jgi:hypothetical protein
MKVTLLIYLFKEQSSQTQIGFADFTPNNVTKTSASEQNISSVLPFKPTQGFSLESSVASQSQPQQPQQSQQSQQSQRPQQQSVSISFNSSQPSSSLQQGGVNFGTIQTSTQSEQPPTG